MILELLALSITQAPAHENHVVSSRGDVEPPSFHLGPPVEQAPPRDAAHKETSVDRLLQLASSVGPAERIRATYILCSDILNDETPILPVTSSERAAIVSELRDSNLVGLSLVATDLESLGCSDVVFFTLSNFLVADCPASAVASAVGHTRVEDATADSGEGVPFGWHGEKFRQEMDADQFIASGFDGNIGNRLNEANETVIAIIEIQRPTNRLHDHVGYFDTGSVNHRIKQKLECSASACTTAIPFLTGGTQTHADQVVSVAAGSIEQSQDAAITNTSERIKRSGIAKESDILFFSTSSTDFTEVARAVETAADLGADVANLSFGGPQLCDPTTNPGALNTSIYLATAVGMLVVAAAGNSGHNGSCTIGYPALRSEVVAVGGLDTAASTSSLSSVGLYNENATTASTAEGGIPITVNGVAATTTGIGVMAPAIRTHTFNSTVSPPYNTLDVHGTSIAAPAVAGAVALWVDRLVASGNSAQAHNANHHRSNLFMMCDRWAGILSGRLTKETSDLSGYGRFRLLDLADSEFGSTFSWSTGSVNIDTTSTVILSLNGGRALLPEVRQLKVVTWHREQGAYTSAADIDVQIYNPLNVFTSKVVVEDTTQNFTKMVSATGVGGKTLQIRFVPTHLPTPRTLYYSVLFHSGPSDL